MDASRGTLHRYDPASEFATAERCYITELANGTDAACSISLARVLPGITTELHCLTGSTERYVVIEGEGRVEVDGWAATIGRFDVVTIPPGVSQRITNTGDRDLLFLCVCTPRFTPDLYQRLE